jgi:hypothetical protein
VRIEAIVHEVSADDRSQYAVGPDGKPMFMAHPLKDYLSRMDADGFITMPVPPGPLAHVDAVTTAHPGLVLASSRVDKDAHIEIVDEQTVKVSIAKWRDRDPDKTFLRVAFQFMPTTDSERSAIIKATPDMHKF